MFDVSFAIETFAKHVTLKTRGAGSYDQNGTWIDGVETQHVISVTMQPAKGSHLQDMPEGIRSEAKWLIWSRHAVSENDRIEKDGKTYRVLHIWQREEGGFTRAALGLLA